MEGFESLYARILGPVWEERHPAVRQAHAATVAPRRGRFRVRRGRSPVARLLALVLRLPRPAEHSRVGLRIEARGRVERWSRTFDGRHLVSEQRESGDGLLRETFGPLEFRFRLFAWDGGIRYAQERCGLRLGRLFLPLPRCLSPRVEAIEEPARSSEAAASVRVRLWAPLAGLVTEYAGEIEVEG